MRTRARNAQKPLHIRITSTSGIAIRMMAVSSRNRFCLRVATAVALLGMQGTGK